MRLWGCCLALLSALAAGCVGQSSRSSLEPPTEAKKAPSLPAEAVNTVATPAPEPPRATATTPPPKPEADPAKVAAADPGLFGVYRMVLSPDQERRLEQGLKELRERAANGDPQAVQALPMAEQVGLATRNTTIVLERSGKYRANVADRAMTGVFTVSGNVVTLTPDEAVSGVPPATVMTFDSKARTLSSDAGSERVLFRRQ